jgi:uncharacterized membrane protein YraQ (UPF0718 family)
MLTALMAAAAAALTVVAHSRDPRLAAEGWRAGLGSFARILPMLLFAFALSGLLQAIVPKETIALWLGEQSGWRGVWLGCLAGAVTPGGPATSFPVVAALFQAGAGVGTLVGFVTAWSLWAFARIPLEVAFVGPRFAAIRLACTFFVPPIAGGLAHVFFARFFRPFAP